MAANPHLAFEQFVRLLKHALNQWLTWHDVPGGRRLSEAQFQIPVTAPGARAGDWWLRLALHPETVAASETSPLGRLHRAWLMRRAFATNDPEQWPALWRSVLAGATPKSATSLSPSRCAAASRRSARPSWTSPSLRSRA